MADGRVDVGNEVSLGFDYSELNKMSELLRSHAEFEKRLAEEDYEYKLDLMKKRYSYEEELEARAAKAGKTRGYAEHKEKLKQLQAQYKAEEKTANAARKAQMEADIKAEEEKLKKIEKLVEKYKKRQKVKDASEARKSAGSKFASGNLLDKWEVLKGAWTEGGGGGKSLLNTLSTAITGIGTLIRQLDSQIDSIAKKRGTIDTRLQGSTANKKNWAGSYWENMSTDIMRVAGTSPYITQEKVATNIENLVGQGISYNVEQRAFLATMAEKIATTFNVADGTLLRLVRIQQQDSTAGRLGMESMITAFLNNMYETTEYLSDIATSVRSSLDEVESLMGAADAVALEYQVQKWMGSLYSVGMSQKAVSGIAQAFGQLAAGDISGLTSGGMGNLMIMAANQAGLSIADILADGIDDSDTNKLMYAMVDYLQIIAAESSNSRVVQQQLAKVYGLTASDLKAATNLRGSLGSIGNSTLNYSGAMSRLYSMAGSMGKRTSTGEMLENAWSNLKYSMAAGIANNPAIYGIYKIANLLSDTVGGIDFGIPMYMGTGLPMTFNVADLMRVGALSASIFSNMGNLISAVGNMGSGASILKALNISGLTTVTRGGGNVGSGGGITLSESGSIVGNNDENAASDKTMSDAKGNAAAEVAENNEDDTKLKDVNSNIDRIYELINSVINGMSSVKVDMGDASAWTAALRSTTP